VGPSFGLVAVREEKILSCRESNTDCPALTPSLYPLRYPEKFIQFFPLKTQREESAGDICVRGRNCHDLAVVTLRRGMDWMIGFIGHLHTPLGTTSNYSAIAHLHTLPFTVTHILVVSWQRIHNSLTVTMHNVFKSPNTLETHRTLNYHFFSLIFAELNTRLTAHVELRNSTDCRRIESNATTDSQSASMSWNDALIWVLNSHLIHKMIIKYINVIKIIKTLIYFNNFNNFLYI
jgi:hypothetical protein